MLDVVVTFWTLHSALHGLLMRNYITVEGLTPMLLIDIGGGLHGGALSEKKIAAAFERFIEYFMHYVCEIFLLSRV